MTATVITAVDARPFDAALHEPFGIAGGAADVARNALVTVELSDGTRGYGEAAPLPPYNGETQARTLDALALVAPIARGADARAWRELARAVGERIPHAGAARCAFETAVLDALTRRAGMPLWALFGGAARALETDVTIPTGDVEHAAARAARWRELGFRSLKVKVGAAGADDAARVEAIARAAPGCALTLDANASMTADAALALLAALRTRGVSIALLEQPVAKDDLAGLRRVAAGGAPVAADESAVDARDVPRLGLTAPHVVNVKIMKAGVVAALDLAIAARAHGLGLMIGGMVETRLAMTTSACLAAGLGGFSYVDLDTPLFFVDEPFTGGFEQRGPRLDLAGVTAGHGVLPVGDLR